MKTTKDLFLNGIEQYKMLIDNASLLIDEVGSMSPEEIFQSCEQLCELQTKQIDIDRFIIVN